MQEKAKETKKEKTISAENRLKNKFVAARVRIFVVLRISGNKTFFLAQSTQFSLQTNRIQRAQWFIFS